MEPFFKQLFELGIIPVVKIDRVEDAVPLAQALMAGGLPVAEITFRTEAAAQAISAIRQALPTMLVGAGTVLSSDQAQAAIAAGAQFLVSPGINPEVVRFTQAAGLPMIPGCATATEIEMALGLGLSVLKFFPAVPAGGLTAIKALSGPYPSVRFIPTGGIHSENLTEFTDDPRVIAVGGSWMVDPKLITQGDWAQITALTRSALETLVGLQLHHVGWSPEHPEAVVDALAQLTNWTITPKSSSTFVGNLEIIRQRPSGVAPTHVALGVRHLERAIAYFERRGYTFDPRTASRDAQGHLKAIYFTETFGGISLHLMQR